MLTWPLLAPALHADAATGDPVRGQVLYDATPGGVSCASCHDDATLGLLRLRFGVDPAVTRAAIVSGKGGMNQPNLLALTDADLADIAAYIADPAAAAPIEPLIEPASGLDFSRATVGGPPVERIVSLFNPGRTALPLGSFALTGADFVQASACGPSLDPDGRCSLVLQFRPGSVGERAGTLSGTFGVRATPWTLALSGQGVDRPVGVLRWRDASPLSAFTEAVTGRSVVLARAWLDNGTGVPVTLQQVGLEGEDRGDFSVTGACVTSGSVLPAGAGCEIEVRFTPLAVGRRVARLTVASDGNDPPAVALNAVGIAPGPALSLTPSTVEVATRAALELANPGQEPLQVIALEVSDAAFRVAAGDCGALPLVIPPGGRCRLAVDRVVGTRLDATGTLTVRTSTAGLASTAALRATAVDASGNPAQLGNVGAGSLAAGTVGSLITLIGLAAAATALRRRRWTRVAEADGSGSPRGETRRAVTSAHRAAGPRGRTNVRARIIRR